MSKTKLLFLRVRERVYLRFAGLLVVGISLGFFGVMRDHAFGQKQDGVVEKSIFRHNRQKCTTLIVGKEVTADGSVLLGHNEDLGWNAAQHIIVVSRKKHKPGEVFPLYSGGAIPQVEETYAYIATTIFNMDYIPGTITSGINEHQVSVVNNMAYSRDELIPQEGRWSLKYNGVIWTEFTQLALERAKTAREAVELMGRLSEQNGLSGDPGTAFGIADPDEAWFIEIPRGGQWVARRVPDNGYAMMANTFRICEVDFEDRNNFLYSEDLVDFAIANGFYDPDRDGPFCFARVYGDPDKLVAPSNTLRHWRVESLLESVIPGVTPAQIMSILRDHYEKTKYDFTRGYKISPHRTKVRTVCTFLHEDATEVSLVAQLRSWLPAEIGGVAWWALSAPCCSVYVPWYMGILKVPNAYKIGTNKYDEKSAYWVFSRLANIVDKKYGAVIDYIKDKWANFEAKEFALQGDVEREALRLYKKKERKARIYLTKHSKSLGKKASRKGRKLAVELFATLTAFINLKDW